MNQAKIGLCSRIVRHANASASTVCAIPSISAVVAIQTVAATGSSHAAGSAFSAAATLSSRTAAPAVGFDRQRTSLRIDQKKLLFIFSSDADFEERLIAGPQRDTEDR